jgi:hypothetical protein
MKSGTFSELVIIDGNNIKNFNLDLNPKHFHVNFISSQPSEFQRECFWLKVCNPDEAAYYTILLIEEVAIKLGKIVRTVGFKKQHLGLMNSIIQHKQLEKQVSIEDRFKVSHIVKKFVGPICNKN